MYTTGLQMQLEQPLMNFRLGYVSRPVRSSPKNSEILQVPEVRLCRAPRIGTDNSIGKTFLVCGKTFLGVR